MKYKIKKIIQIKIRLNVITETGFVNQQNHKSYPRQIIRALGMLVLHVYVVYVYSKEQGGTTADHIALMVSHFQVMSGSFFMNLLRGTINSFFLFHDLIKRGGSRCRNVFKYLPSTCRSGTLIVVPNVPFQLCHYINKFIILIYYTGY